MMQKSSVPPVPYDPDYCLQVIQYMGKGYSRTAFAGSIRVSVKTLNQWEREYSEFAEAVLIAKAARVKVLEKDLLEAIDNATVVSRLFMLKAAAPAEYPQLPTSKDNGADGSTVHVIVYGGPPGTFEQNTPELPNGHDMK